MIASPEMFLAAAGERTERIKNKAKKSMCQESLRRRPRRPLDVGRIAAGPSSLRSADPLCMAR